MMKIIKNLPIAALLLTIICAVFVFFTSSSLAASNNNTIDISANNAGINLTNWSCASDGLTYTIRNNTAVIGANTIDETLTFNIGDGKKVTWYAELTGSVEQNSPLVKIDGGIFEITGGKIEQIGDGLAVHIDAAIINVLGGIVSSPNPNGYGIESEIADSTISISDGTVSAGRVAILTNGNINISGTAHISSPEIALYVNGDTSTLTMNGGIVEAQGGAHSKAIYGAEGSIINISAGRIESSGIGNETVITTYGDIYLSGTVEVCNAIDSLGTGGIVDISGDAVVTGNHNGVHTSGKNASVSVSDAAIVRGNSAIHTEGEHSIVTINGGTLEGSWYTVYVDGFDGTVNVNGGVIKAVGSHNIAVFALNVNITGGIIEAIGGGCETIKAGNVNVSGTAKIKAIVENEIDYACAIVCFSSADIRGDAEISTTRGAAVAGYFPIGNIVIKIGGNVSVTGRDAISASGDNAKIYINGGTLNASNAGIIADGRNALVYVDGGTINCEDDKKIYVSYAQNGVAIIRDMSTGTVAYDQGNSVDLTAIPDEKAYWYIDNGSTGIRYVNNTNIGFVPVDGITINTNLSYPVAFQTNNTELNGLNASATVVPGGNQKWNTNMTVTVRLTGTSEAAGTHSIFLSSESLGKNGITLPTSVQKTFSPGQSMEADDTFIFTFTMPARAVTDLVVSHKFSPVVTSEVIDISANNKNVTVAGKWSCDSTGNTYTILDNVTVIGTNLESLPLSFTVSNDKKLIWNAQIRGFGLTDGLLNVATNTGTIEVPDSGRIEQISYACDSAIYMPFYGNVIISGGIVSNVTKSAVSGSRIITCIVSSGTLSSVSDAAIAGFDTVIISGGTITTNAQNAIFSWDSDALVLVSGGAINSSGANKFRISGENGILIDWNKNAGNTVYYEGTEDDLTTVPAGKALWSINKVNYYGIKYANGTNTGFAHIPDVTVMKAPQADLIVDPVPMKKFGDESFKLSATGGSGDGAVKFKRISGPCFVHDDGTVSINGAGDTVVYASKGESFGYLAAVSEPITISVQKGDAPVIATQSVKVYRSHEAYGNRVDITKLLPSVRGSSSYSVTSSNTLVRNPSVSPQGILTFDTASSPVAASESITVEAVMTNYNTATVTLVVDLIDRKVPVVTPTDSMSLARGMPLSSVSIALIANDNGIRVPGIFTWDDPSYRPAADAPAQAWTFTPSDPVVYETVTGFASVYVHKVSPVGTPTYKEIMVGGMTLADAELYCDFTNPYDGSIITGTLAWHDHEMTQVELDRSYYWSFKPDDKANYEEIMGIITLFKVHLRYNVSLHPAIGGDSTISAVSALPNEKIWINASPHINYVFEKWETSPSVSWSSYGAYAAFIMPAGDVQIAAVYKYISPNTPTTGVTIGGAPVKYIYKAGGANSPVHLWAKTIPLSASFINWSVDKQTLAKVSNSGKVTFTGVEGTVRVSAKVAGTNISSYVDIEIVKNITNIDTPVKSIYIKSGESQYIPYIAYDTGKEVWAHLTWKSSAPKMAAVSKTGKVTIPKNVKKGKVLITAKAANGSRLRIIVNISGKAIKLTRVSVIAPKSLKIGQKSKLRIKLSPAQATGSPITFKSSYPSGLYIDKAGLLTAMKKGTYTVTAKAGKLKVTKKIKVT